MGEWVRFSKGTNPVDVLNEVKKIGLKDYSLSIAKRLDKLYNSGNTLYYLLEKGN